MSSILLPKESVILFLASFSGKDKAEIHFEERDGITSQIHHLITLDMWNLNIRVHRDVTGEMWFGVDKVK
jgi:hypothetical protein